MADTQYSDESQDDTTASTPSNEQVRHIEDALDDERFNEASNAVQAMHVADQAHILDVLSNDNRLKIIELIQNDIDPQLYTHLDGEIVEDISEHIGEANVAGHLVELDTEDAVAILETLEDDSRDALLQSLPAKDRTPLDEALAYPEQSAGRIMHKHMVLAPQYWNVGDTIDYLRTQESLPDDFYSLFVVDAKSRPIGTLPVSKLIRSQRSIAVADIMSEGVRQIPVDMDQEECAFLFQKYALVSAPVVNESGRVLGTITIDDVMDVIHEEADEDLLRMGGVTSSDLYADISQTVRKRFPWLLVNLGTAVLASVVISQFQTTLDQWVALAVLMPIVASMGGNGGTQTATVAVRALATKELTTINASRVLGKEAVVGLLNGLVFGLVSFAIAYFWYHNVVIAAVFAAATILTLTFAGVSGVLIPLTLNKMGVDPALSAGVFLTTVTDIVAFFAFLGIAASVLM